MGVRDMIRIDAEVGGAWPRWLCEWPPWRAVEIWRRTCGKNLRVSRSWDTHAALLQQLYLLTQRELLARGTLHIHPLEINSTLV